MEYFILNMRV